MIRSIFFAFVFIFCFFNFSFAKTFSHIAFDNKVYNFGKLNKGDVVEYIFKFKNEGDSTLEIHTVKPNCTCIKAELSSDKIDPKKDGTIKVVLDASKKSGKITKNIYVISNDPKVPNTILKVSADIRSTGSSSSKKDISSASSNNPLSSQHQNK